MGRYWQFGFLKIEIFVNGAGLKIQSLRLVVNAEIMVLLTIMLLLCIIPYQNQLLHPGKIT